MHSRKSCHSNAPDICTRKVLIGTEQGVWCIILGLFSKDDVRYREAARISSSARYERFAAGRIAPRSGAEGARERACTAIPTGWPMVVIGMSVSSRRDGLIAMRTSL